MALFGRKPPAFPHAEGDDLYSGYDTRPPSAKHSIPATPSGRPVSSFRGSVQTPRTAMRIPTPGRSAGTSARMVTAMPSDSKRPLTSNKGAGFSSAPKSPFDQAQQSCAGAARGAALKSSEPSAEDQARDMEKKVHEILEESALLGVQGDFDSALESAKEAGKKERQLCKLREQHGTAEQMNLELTFAVVFNLAHAFGLNEMYTEALNAYASIVKNKSFGQSGRLRVNMGNIYYLQRKYPTAIKMYRMALDQIPPTSKEVRYKIMRNIGLAFIRMGQYSDATQTLETIMDAMPDHQTGLNLLVCHHALGDQDKMKKFFEKFLRSSARDEEQEEDEADEEEHATYRHDGLREELRSRQNEIDRAILLASQLVAVQLSDRSSVAGFDWCIAQLCNAGHNHLASEVQLAKATYFLSCQDFKSAIGIFKEFERKEHKHKARASTNLSFLYYLEGDLEGAKKYASLAVETDRFNPHAWVNKGNIALSENRIEDSQADYYEALVAEADRVEAIYNIGLTQKKLAVQQDDVESRSAHLSESLTTFRKLHSQLPDNLEVIYQVASIYELKQDTHNAIKWFEILHGLLPNDGKVAARLGTIFQALDDEARSLHYYQEAHRAFPGNMDVISWLGAFHVRNEMYEKAVPFFNLAAKLQPTEVKWELMVASCYRRVHNYPDALAKYKSIHARHPENVECLRYLVHICTEIGQDDDVGEYAAKLHRVERSQGPSKFASKYSILPGHSSSVHRDQAGIIETTMAPENNGKGVQIQAGHDKGMLNNSTPVDDDWGDEDLGEDLLPL